MYRHEILGKVGFPDVITHANFAMVTIDLGVFGITGVEFPILPLTCYVVLKTLWHYVASV